MKLSINDDWWYPSPEQAASIFKHIDFCIQTLWECECGTECTPNGCPGHDRWVDATLSKISTDYFYVDTYAESDEESEDIRIHTGNLVRIVKDGPSFYDPYSIKRKKVYAILYTLSGYVIEDYRENVRRLGI